MTRDVNRAWVALESVTHALSAVGHDLPEWAGRAVVGAAVHDLRGRLNEVKLGVYVAESDLAAAYAEAERVIAEVGPVADLPIQPVASGGFINAPRLPSAQADGPRLAVPRLDPDETIRHYAPPEPC